MADLPDAYVLTELIAAQFQADEDVLRLAHADTGLDALDELSLIRRVRESLARDFCVEPRPPLPSSVSARAGRPADLVLTPRNRPLCPAGGPDLFTPPDACPPEQAWWLPVRVVWRQPPPGIVQTPAAADLNRFRRLTTDPKVRHAALIVLGFLPEADDLPHLLLATDGLLSQRGEAWHFDPDERHVRVLSLTDRRGHRALAVGVWPVRLWRALAPSPPEPWRS